MIIYLCYYFISPVQWALIHKWVKFHDNPSLVRGLWFEKPLRCKYIHNCMRCRVIPMHEQRNDVIKSYVKKHGRCFCIIQYANHCVISIGMTGEKVTIPQILNCDVIMSAMASQITRLTIVYSPVYSGADQRKHESSVSLAFVRGIHRWPVYSPHKRVSNVENVSIWWRYHDEDQWQTFHYIAFKATWGSIR